MLIPTTTPTVVHDGLRATLDQLARPGARPTPAFDALLADYARYHLVLAVVGGAFLLATLAFGWFAGRRFRRLPVAGGRRGRGPKVILLTAVLGSMVVALLLSVIVAANVSTALDPRPGFAGAIGLVGTAGPGTPRAELHRAFDEWLRSGDASAPPAVRAAVDDRLAWQRPKAAICAALLLVVIVLAARTWRPLVDHQRARRRSSRDLVRLAGGLGLIATGLVLGLMVMGNTQAAVAPLAMTLFYG